tara:strand:- start:3696 stop:8210 length:4515 start_codon:yes stop_codon:yes gene_type:complete
MAPPAVSKLPVLYSEARSVWRRVGGDDTERIVAPVSATLGVLKPVERPENADKYDWAIPGYPTAPIAIELVRVAEDNEWRVLIDGQLCREPLTDPNAGGVRTCGLPPPLPRDQPLRTDSEVRPVLVTCRLEEEALAPERVQLIVTQVVNSDERKEQGFNAQDEDHELKRVDVEPYSTQMPQAKAVVLPYPFAAPAQSAVAIVSHREGELWAERSQAWKERVNTKGVLGEFEERRPEEGAPRVHVIGGMQKSGPAQLGYLMGKINTAFDALLDYQDNRKLGPITGISEAVGLGPENELRIEAVRWWLRQAKEGAALSLFDALAHSPDTLGGLDRLWNRRGRNAREQVSDLFQETINEVSEGRLAEEVKGEDEQEDEEEDEDAQRAQNLLDRGILDAQPGPSRKIDIVNLEEGGLPQGDDVGAELTPKQQEAVEAINQNAKNRRDKWKSIHYDFVFDRMQFKTRTRTTLRLEYKLRVVEANGDVKEINLAPDELFGYVAHAVYVKTEQDELDLRTAIVKLRANIFNTEAARTRGARARDAVAGTLTIPYDSWTDFGNALFRVRKKSNNIFRRKILRSDRADASKMGRTLETLLLMCGFMTGPVWPEPTISDEQKTQTGILIPATHIRTMPQIVTPSVTSIQLWHPDDTEPPDAWAPPTRTDPGWLVYSFASLFGLIVGTGYGGIFGILETMATKATYTYWIGSGTFSTIFTLITGPYGLAAGLIGAGITYYFTRGSVDLFAGAKGLKEAATSGVPMMLSTRTLIIDFYRRGLENQELRRKAYERALTEATGTPVLSALTNARNALRFLRTPVVRSEMTELVHAAKRYQLTQEYASIALTQYKIGPTPKALELTGDTVFDSADWDAAPTSGLLTLMPPIEVLEQLHEATILRRIAINEAVRITVGQPARGVPVTVAEVQAAAVHENLVYELQVDRVALKATHLFASIGQQAAQIAKEATMLIDAAYGVAAKNTYVTGDDEYWSCLRSGVLARTVLNQVSVAVRAERTRLALQRNVESARATAFLSEESVALRRAQEEVLRLRQEAKIAREAFIKDFSSETPRGDIFDAWMSAFDAERNAVMDKYEAEKAYKESDAAQRVVDSERVLLTAFRNTMRHEARVEIKHFLQAWRNEATEYLRDESKTGTVRIDYRALVEQAAQGSERMKAIGILAGSVFAVAAAPMLYRLVLSNENLDGSLTAMEVAARSFQYQSEWVARRTTRMQESDLDAAWAARRVDPGELANLKQLQSGTGDLVKQMASMAVSNGSELTPPVHYYCPTGTTLNALPGRVPFGIAAETTRIVWLELVVEALSVLLQGETGSTTPSTVNSASIVDGSEFGIGRHPLVVTVRGPTISSFFTPVHPPGKFDEVLPTTLDVALRYTVDPSSANSNRWMRTAAVFANEVAFNADRYKHCIGLALRRTPTPRTVSVAVDGESAAHLAVAVALGMATYAGELGVAMPVVSLYTALSRDAVVDRLRTLHERCSEALARGCFAVRLGELCLLAAQYE